MIIPSVRSTGGAFVLQLRKLSLTFCEMGGSSTGMRCVVVLQRFSPHASVLIATVFRKFIENDVVDFARKNPSVEFEVYPINGRHPTLHAEYRRLPFSKNNSNLLNACSEL